MDEIKVEEYENRVITIQRYYVAKQRILIHTDGLKKKD